MGAFFRLTADTSVLKSPEETAYSFLTERSEEFSCLAAVTINIAALRLP
jgi:hypothetical protein